MKLITDLKNYEIFNFTDNCFEILFDPQPVFPFSVSKIVRELDIFHSNAFEGISDLVIDKDHSPRKYLYYCEDYSGNLVAQFDCNPPINPDDKLSIIIDSVKYVLLISNIEGLFRENKWYWKYHYNIVLRKNIINL